MGFGTAVKENIQLEIQPGKCGHGKRGETILFFYLVSLWIGDFSWCSVSKIMKNIVRVSVRSFVHSHANNDWMTNLHNCMGIMLVLVSLLSSVVTGFTLPSIHLFGIPTNGICQIRWNASKYNYPKWMFNENLFSIILRLRCIYIPKHWMITHLRITQCHYMNTIKPKIDRTSALELKWKAFSSFWDRFYYSDNSIFENYYRLDYGLLAKPTTTTLTIVSHRECFS